MKYAISVRCENDPLFQPWDYIVEDTRHAGVLTLQEPHPDAGHNLIGFEEEPQICDLTVHDDGWQDRCIGMSPVFARKGGMYSVPNYKVTKVRELHV